MATSRRKLAVLGTLMAGTMLFTACSGSKGTAEIQDASAEFGFQETGFPIVKDKLTLTFSGTKSALAPDYGSMSLVQQWEKDTNVHIDWENLPEAVFKEKKNLILASGDLPDAFFNSGLTDAEITTYAASGTLVPLEGLIEKNAPNLAKILADRPDIKAAITSSDGHIYSLPSVEELGLVQFPNEMAINTAWLDKLGIPMPKTVDELHNALLAFKAKDASGTGRTIPLSFMPGSWCGDIVDLIAALGGVPDNMDHRIVQDGKVIYTATQDGYKKAIGTLHQWYQEGLIDPESFSQDDKAYLAKGKAGTANLGSFVWWEIKEMVGADRAADYALLPVLEGVDGKRLASQSNNQEIARGAFAVTRTNKYPAATMRWADNLYDPLQSAQANWGPIGETLQKDAATGLLTQIPAPAGTSEGERRQKVAPGGPKANTAENFEKVVAPEPRAAERQKTIQENYKPFAANDGYPPVALSNEEIQQIGTIETDVSALVKQTTAKWIVSGGIDSEWDGYVSQLENVGVDRMIDIYQQAYDRFQQNS
ncbi:sugar ABC transporter substrate-binding protein [Arthrobacter sp. ZBG10]|uniref:ABC transporter substrate-binding protein n=1 Tax=Arthrobacter sp. ZBG10 TaxID=1676590 RepID=UPI000682501A|nr:ABC transporter substrate-binding protein [Arthrobacter sp. ZBG10]KNH23080.1 sugar ABC transporter substrate-binding protein [Arthrobacter sp. ZBG10]